MAERFITKCDACSQKDDHPKLHFGVFTWHHDCVPVSARTQIGNHEVLSKIFVAANSGVRGKELQAHIKSLHEKG